MVFWSLISAVSLNYFVNYRLKQLEPLFQSPLTITKEEKKENGNAAFIVEHANGKTVNDIIKAKLQEKSDTQIPPTIQGMNSQCLKIA